MAIDNRTIPESIRHTRFHGNSNWTLDGESILGGLFAICAALVILGSMAFRTNRTWSNPNGTGQQWSEGANAWAGLTFVAGVGALALGSLAWWWVGSEATRRGVICLVVAVVLVAYASVRAGRHWSGLLDERNDPRDYALSIAIGLPIVTMFGALGAVCGVGLVVMLLKERVRQQSLV